MIPFIRIAHCPRSHYFKVKGDLILISSDVAHSISRIIPVEQNLIPVCFKRKEIYHGSFIEEFIEKEKVLLYFSWLKKNNHLYKDLEFDMHLLERFVRDSQIITEEREEDLSQVDSINIEKSYEEDTRDETTNDSFHAENPFESYQVEEKDDRQYFQDGSSVFMNKYCEDLNLPTVVNKMADMIIEYETLKRIPFDADSDFEVDDEIVPEEEYLKLINKECKDQFESTSQSGRDDFEDSEINLDSILKILLALHNIVLVS